MEHALPVLPDVVEPDELVVVFGSVFIPPPPGVESHVPPPSQPGRFGERSREGS